MDTEPEPDTETLSRASRRAERASGNENGILGFAIGFANALLYAVLPVLLFFAIWALVSIYAIVKWAGSAPDQPNPVMLVVGVASLVMLFVILIAVGVGLMGRPMNPKKRSR